MENNTEGCIQFDISLKNTKWLDFINIAHTCGCSAYDDELDFSEMFRFFNHSGQERRLTWATNLKYLL